MHIVCILIDAAENQSIFRSDGESPICELNASGAVTATNTIGYNGNISRRTSAGSEFYDFDLSGNVVERLSSSGSLLSADNYDGFGARQTTDTTHDPFGFSGQYGGYTDAATGLVLLEHRFYDPSTGRWVTRDPIRYEGGINLYEYTQNDPSNEHDESGFMPGWHPKPTLPPSQPGPDKKQHCPYPPTIKHCKRLYQNEMDNLNKLFTTWTYEDAAIVAAAIVARKEAPTPVAKVACYSLAAVLGVTLYASTYNDYIQCKTAIRRAMQRCLHEPGGKDN